MCLSCISVAKIYHSAEKSCKKRGKKYTKMKFCAVKRVFLGGFFLKFFGIFREKLFFCVFSLRSVGGWRSTDNSLQTTVDGWHSAFFLSRMFFISHGILFFLFSHKLHKCYKSFLCDYLWDLWAILIFFCLRQNGRTSRASLLS